MPQSGVADRRFAVCLLPETVGALLLLQSMQGAGLTLGERENQLEETVTEAQEMRGGPQRSSQNMLQGHDGNTASGNGWCGVVMWAMSLGSSTVCWGLDPAAWFLQPITDFGEIAALPANDSTVCDSPA